jgi:tetratricopeptide (TPR) repeat protein
LLGASKPWPSRLASLHQVKADLLNGEGRYADATKEYALAVESISPARLDFDTRLESCLATEGDTARITGDAATAEAAYLRALSYNFATVSDANAQMTLRDLYIQAGSGIIELRRHNLAKLRELFFIPSTMNVLGPQLDAAIAEAGG